MPTYSYECTKCEKRFDAFHSMMCTDTQHCPECGNSGKKLMSASSVIFKGSGFYSTDYRDSGYLEAKKNDSQASETSKKDSETTKKSDSSKSEGSAKPLVEGTPSGKKPDGGVSKAA